MAVADAFGDRKLLEARNQSRLADITIRWPERAVVNLSTALSTPSLVPLLSF